jgi:hypothetical protein
MAFFYSTINHMTLHHRPYNSDIYGSDTIDLPYFYLWGMGWRSWLRHCATSWKVEGSIPDGVTGVFNWHNPSGCTMALGSTQPLTEMSSRNISWGVEAAGAKGWQPYHLQVPTVLKSGSLNLLEPSGLVQACYGIALLFLFIHIHLQIWKYNFNIKTFLILWNADFQYWNNKPLVR